MTPIRFADMTTEDLKREAESLYDAIYNTECYGTNDVRYLMGIIKVLEDRGIQTHEIFDGHLMFIDEDEN